MKPTFIPVKSDEVWHEKHVDAARAIEFLEEKTKDVIAKEEIRFFAPQRSGHHAIIQWALSQMDQKNYFINNIGNAKLDTHRGNRETICFINGNLVWCYMWKDVIDKSADRLIYNLEDILPHQLRSARLPGALPLTDIIVLRDARNYFCSRYKNVMEGHAPQQPYELPNMEWSMNLWIRYAQMFLNPSHQSHMVFVNFDKWVSSYEYRKQLAGELGLEFTDKNFNKQGFCVSSFGDKVPTENVLKRYFGFQDNPVFKKHMTEEVMYLNDKIFGSEP